MYVSKHLCILQGSLAVLYSCTFFSSTFSVIVFFIPKVWWWVVPCVYLYTSLYCKAPRPPSYSCAHGFWAAGILFGGGRLCANVFLIYIDAPFPTPCAELHVDSDSSSSASEAQA